MSSAHAADLRGEAKDRQRVKEHNAKWGKGYRGAPGKYCEHRDTAWDHVCRVCAARPASDMSSFRRLERRSAHVQLAKVHSETLRVFDSGPDDTLYKDDIPLSEEEVDTGSEQDEYFYSYDKPTGPVANTQVLSSAITQAVERFEHKETEKMVKEYDLVADAADEPQFADAEDDFELVDSAHFK